MIALSEKPPLHDLFVFFDMAHIARLGTKAVFTPGKDGRIFVTLWRQRGTEETKALIRAFFEMNDPFVLQAGFSVGVFKSQLLGLYPALRDR